MRLGIDWGGTKMELIALGDDGQELHRERVGTPQDDYAACIEAAAGLVERAEQATGRSGSIGIGIPGSISPATGLVKNANSVWLNGQPLDKDLEKRLKRAVRVENDANCLAVSEARDGAGAGCSVVHAIIIGTGCGTGIAIGGRAHRGANGIGGEWGAIQVPWLKPDEYPGPDNWTGHPGAIDHWCSGTGFAADYHRRAGSALKGPDIIQLKRDGDAIATATYEAYVSRLARAMSMAANLLDPDCFVLGGGMSNIDELYTDLPAAMSPYIMSDVYTVPIRPALHGDSSGVRGAAWLWD